MPDKDPNEPVRVKDKDTGHEFTTRRSAAAHGNYELLKDGDAVDSLTGEFLPPKFASKTTTAATQKES